MFETSHLQLLTILYSVRNQEEEPPLPIYQFSSNALVQESFLRSHRQARLNWIILSWLQDTLPEPRQPSQLGAINSVFGSLKKMDSDAPLRDSSLSDITGTDKAVYKYLFELVRARRYDKANEVCDVTGNFTLALAFRGLDEYFDVAIEGQELNSTESENSGIVNKMLWRRMCLKIANAKGPVDDYEKAIYGILGGDVDSVLKYSQTWEQQLLTFLGYLVATEAEQALKEAGRYDLELEKFETPQFNNIRSVEDILDILQRSINPKVKKQSRHVIRRVVSSLIKDDISDLADEIAQGIEEITGEGESSTFSTDDIISVLRLVTHLILILRHIGVYKGSDKSFSQIIQGYIELLRIENKKDLIPLYVSYLDGDAAVSTYSYLLATVTDTEERKQHIELAKKYDLDLKNTVRQAVLRVFDVYSENFEFGEIISFSNIVSDYDTNLIEAVAWYQDAAMWADAIHSGVRLFRMFLGVGKRQAARNFDTTVSIVNALSLYRADDLIKESGAMGDHDFLVIAAPEQLEFNEYGKLIKCFNQIEECNEFFGIISNKDLTELDKRNAENLVKQVYQSITDLCTSWMVEVLNHPETENSVAQEITRLRTWYIPLLLIELLKILIQGQIARFEFLKQAVHLAQFVGDDEHKLYELFVSSGTLKEFLNTIAEASTDGIAFGEEGIFEV